MNKYKELRQKHEAEFGEFPIMFAFSRDQFEDGMKKLGLNPKQVGKIVSIGCGGFVKKDDAPDLKKMYSRHASELRNAMTDPEFAYEAFSYELGNHEFIITYDQTDAIFATGLSPREVEQDPMLSEQMQRAVRHQIEWHEAHNN